MVRSNCHEHAGATTSGIPGARARKIHQAGLGCAQQETRFCRPADLSTGQRWPHSKQSVFQRRYPRWQRTVFRIAGIRLRYRTRIMGYLCHQPKDPIDVSSVSSRPVSSARRAMTSFSVTRRFFRSSEFDARFLIPRMLFRIRVRPAATPRKMSLGNRKWIRKNFAIWATKSSTS